MPKLGYLCPIVKLFFLLMTFKKCLLSSPSSEETCYLDLQDDIIPDHYSSAVLSVCQNFLPISRTPNESESEEFVHCELQAAGWYIASKLPPLKGACNIDRFGVGQLSQLTFLNEYVNSKPFVVVTQNIQKAIKSITMKNTLLRLYGQHYVTLATANSYSYHKVNVQFSDYIERYVRSQPVHTRGNETLYLFGDNDREAWRLLFSAYQLPPYHIPEMQPEMSFGIAGPGSGVPFHIHGPTFAETIYGRKRWFLMPPSVRPVFDPDDTTLKWLLQVYPSLDKTDLFECTLGPGEILFIPNMWWHATLNVDTTVFMSTFLTNPNF